jgi:DNA-binding FadR family transcriptional regulator
MTQSNDLSQRVDRNEGQIVDLQMTANLILQAIDKNSTDIAQLIEVSRRNSEGISALLEVSRQNSESISTMEEAIQDIRNSNASINASIERMDRLFDYLIRRDQEQSNE